MMYTVFHVYRLKQKAMHPKTGFHGTASLMQLLTECLIY